MNVWKNVSFVLMGVIIGCGGAAASNAVAAYPPTQPRFQHMCLGASATVSGINDDVQKGAEEGWELVAMSQGVVCFKRPR